MKLLYHGFDGLDVSFAGHITHKLCETLEAAKEKAQVYHQPEPLEWNGVRMTVQESGARGGYAFNASTGKFGATWLIKKPNSRDPWGVRASCNSFNLATGGLGRARSELYSTLDRLGFVAGVEGESIARVDYALDFLAPEFALVPENFVMHSNAVRSDYVEHPEIKVHGRSGRVTSVTIGKMPGRQVIVYDKRADVIAKRKVVWWEIWNAARAEAGLPPLNSEVPAESRIWRLELRAGKQHLNNGWAIRTWADLDNRFGDLAAAMLRAIRYAEPTADSNRSRWPNSELWERACRQIGADLFEMRQGAKPDLLKRVQKDAHDDLLSRQMMGLLINRAALSEVQACQLEKFALAVGAAMAREVAGAPERMRQKLARAVGRYDLGLNP